MSFEDQINTFKILVATDIHLGFKERDPVRGEDSLNTFEEILQIASKSEVDFILLGGDLFHDNKPSRSTLHGCLALLRKYCMGDKPVHFEYLSDQSVDFKHCKFPSVNYEEPNFNISIPVFSIHGNHDDPIGPGNLCSLDLLHTAGLVNYFGKATSLDKIQVSPLLLQKGETKLALYGLGSVRDERLHRMFKDKKVSLLKNCPESCFNIFVIHQNRVPHTPTNHIPEKFLEDFIDLVIWGHEHECLLTNQRLNKSSKQNISICQPGSSIATSLKEAETMPKHIGILEISDKKWQMTPILLKTVRQFYMEHINLNKYINFGESISKEKAETICTDKVKEILRKAKNENTPEQPLLPLVRLVIDYTDFDPFSSQRFGQKFIGKVANPNSLILLKRQKKLNDEKSNIVLDGDTVEDMLKKIVSEDGLSLLCMEEMNTALKDHVYKNDVHAFETLVNSTLKNIQNDLNQCNISEDNSEAIKLKIQEMRKAQTTLPANANQSLEMKGICITTKSNKSTKEPKAEKENFPQHSGSCSEQSLKGTQEEPIVLVDSEEEDCSGHFNVQKKTEISTKKRGNTSSYDSEEEFFSKRKK